jgi:hypothetical protein
MRPRVGRLLLLSGWILVQRPPEWDDPTDPPIEKWKQLKRFDGYQACEDYRNEALIAGAEMRSDAMLAQADSFRCVPDTKTAPSATTTAP